MTIFAVNLLMRIDGQRERDPSCGAIPTTAMSSDHIERLKLFREKGLNYFSVVKKGAQVCLSTYERQTWEVFHLPFFNCEQPEHLSQEEFDQYMAPPPNVTIYLNGSISVSRFDALFHSTYYKFLFWYLFPALFLLNATLAILLTMQKFITLRQHGYKNAAVDNRVQKEGPRMCGILTARSRDCCMRISWLRLQPQWLVFPF